MGFVFLWAFLDKTFGFGYATASGKGWIDGGSPTEGFLGHVAVGPMESTFHSWAGAAWADWLFMLGLLGVGLALTAGVALRPAAVAGTVMMALMWAAEWPPAKHLSDGSASMSTNPFADYHVVYAVLLIALAAVSAGDALGLGGCGPGSRSSATTRGCAEHDRWGGPARGPVPSPCGQGRSAPSRDHRPLPP